MKFFKEIYNKDPLLLVAGYVKENCQIQTDPVTQIVSQYYGSPVVSISDASSREVQNDIVNALRNVNFYSMQGQDADCYILHYLFNISTRSDETFYIIHRLTKLLKKPLDNPARQMVVNALQQNGIRLELKEEENSQNNQQDNNANNGGDMEETTCLGMGSCNIL